MSGPSGPNFKVTLSLRAEHNSNPICQTNCFARLDNSFLGISHDPLSPTIRRSHRACIRRFPTTRTSVGSPRLGFAWQPLGQGKTVIRGGVGLFSDIFPGTVATLFDTNSPLKNTFITSGLLAPGLPGSAQTLADPSNAAFVSGFNAGLKSRRHYRRRSILQPSHIHQLSNAISAIPATWSGISRFSRRLEPKILLA